MSTAAPTHDLAARLRAAVDEGLEANARRWARFWGWRPGDVMEVQALDAPAGPSGRARVNRFAHAPDPDALVQLLATGERMHAVGVYTVANAVDPAVATRAESSRWHELRKGESTTDADVRARRVLFLDVDVKRPRGTSATDDDVALAHATAEAVYAHLAALLGPRATALGFGHSGNGRAVLVALDNLVESPELAALVRGIVHALAEKFTTSRTEIDRSVVDAKRLLPAWGTTKRKGAPKVLARPHRPTGIVCAHVVARLELAELEALLTGVRAGMTAAQRAAIDRSLGVRAGATATHQGDAPREEGAHDSPFARARTLPPVRDVLAWLELLDVDDHVRCVGCGSVGDSSVAVVGNGVKCLHATCSLRGKPGGFRSTVDLVVEARRVSPRQAVDLLAERFGFAGFARVEGGCEGDQDARYQREERAGIRHGDAEDRCLAVAPPQTRRAVRIADVLDAWRREGPLVHEPTGIEGLDDLTGGGPVYGSRWYLIGAPDAGKTALLVQLADVLLRRGVEVGILAIDEEADDITTRLAQRAGWKRRDCEERDDAVVACMREALCDLPVHLYDAEWTIEAASDELAAAAKERGARAALFVDSIQSVRSSAGAAADSVREIVNANVGALRAAASKHRLIAVATSEMNRGAYRSVEASERSNDMAAAKESGAVEYSARVMVAMRSVKDEPSKVELRVVKNKHGPPGELFLEIDRAHMTLTECRAPTTVDREDVKRRAAATRADHDVAIVEQVLLRHPGLAGVRALRAELRAAGHGMSNAKLDAAIARLGDRIENRGTVKNRPAWYLRPSSTDPPGSLDESIGSVDKEG